jgi:NADPH2:quinone reductase
MSSLPDKIRRVVSEVQADGNLSLRIETLPTPALAAGEVLLRVEAAPLHPTDLGQLLLAGDLTRASREGDALIMPLHEAARAMLKARAGRANPVGTEGAGTVIAVGEGVDPALAGRLAGAFGNGMFAEYRVLKASDLILLPEGTTARDGAAVTVNPMTAVAMVEQMRIDGATALVHTAAASSLGQMLQRICAKDGISLVNIVRKPEQEDLLRKAGAKHVLNSQAPDFMQQLIDAVAETKATVVFDAVGGGTISGAILTAIEQAQQRAAGDAGFYGSAIEKRAYIYGRLEMSPTILPPTTGMAWSLSGFLLPHFLAKAGPAIAARMAARVLAELSTSFVTHYTEEVGLDSLLDPAVLARASAKATGAKFLIRPQS